MTIYRPNTKPPMWGSPDQMQFAVRENCQKLGLPVPLTYLPMLEGTGSRIYNYGFGPTTIPPRALSDTTALNWLQDRPSSMPELALDCTTTARKFLLTRDAPRVNPTAGCCLTTFSRETLVEEHQVFFYLRAGKKNNRVGWRLYGWDVTIIHAGSWSAGTHKIGWIPAFVPYHIFADWDAAGMTLSRYDRRDGTKDTHSATGASPAFGNAFSVYDVLDISEATNYVVRSCAVHQWVYFNEKLTDSQHNVFLEGAYALLMPVSRPRYFFLAGEPPEPPSFIPAWAMRPNRIIGTGVI